MSALEQLLFAICGVMLLVASFAISDPRLRSTPTPERGDAEYTLQSCR